MIHCLIGFGLIAALQVTMKLFLMCLALAMSEICHAEVPKLLTERAFTSASLAEAANHFIAIGEPATFKELDAFLVQDSTNTNDRFNRGYNVAERIGWIFRIIYEPKPGVPMLVPKTGAIIPGNIIPIRAPNFGSLGIPEASMPAEKWPLYPLALSDSTYVVLKDRANPINATETITHYMEYCRDNGVFRKAPVTVPTRQQALKDAQQLRQSAAWKAIKWIDNGEVGFPKGEQWTWDFIQDQARNISPVKKTTSTQLSKR